MLKVKDKNDFSIKGWLIADVYENESLILDKLDPLGETRKEGVQIGIVTKDSDEYFHEHIGKFVIEIFEGPVIFEKESAVVILEKGGFDYFKSKEQVFNNYLQDKQH